MRFAAPWLLLGAPLAVLLWPLLWWLLDRSRRLRLGRFAAPATLSRIAPPRPTVAVIGRRLLVLAGTAFLAVAAARPQWGATDEPLKRKGLDVVFVLDASLSMEAPAWSGARDSRLAAARRALDDLLQLLHGDRFALAAFAGDAQLLCPLTIDDGALRLFADSLSSDFLPTAGSDLGAGIDKGASALTGKEKKFKVMIVLTDGEDNEGHGIGAAGRARAEGVIVHTIGFGSAEGEPIPLHDDGGKVSGYKKDDAGHVVATKLDERTLRAVAEAGGGIYVPARSGDRGLKSIAEAVQAMEKREIRTVAGATLEDRFEWPLAIAFLCFALEALLGRIWLGGRAPVLAGTAEAMTREPRPVTRAKSGQKAAPAALLAAVLLAGGPRAAHAGLAEDGARAYELGHFAEAAELFKKAQAADPNSPVLHYNVGTALLRAGKTDEAIAELGKAAESGPPDLRARARYNIGNAYHAGGKRKEALAEYRRALGLATDDADAKHNYELVKAELEKKPPPTPSPSPSPKPSPGGTPPPPSPTPEPSGSPSPSPSPGQEAGEPSPSPDPSASPSPGEGQGEPSPQPGASPSPSPAPGELSKQEAERLLDAVQDQEQAEKKRQKRSPHERHPLKDW